MSEAARLSEDARPAGASILYCSFCLRPQHEVDKLVAGHGGIYICDGCVAAAGEWMSGAAPSQTSRPVDDRPTESLLALLAPIEDTVTGKSNQLQTVVDALRARSVSWARIGDALGMSRQSAWERFS